MDYKAKYLKYKNKYLELKNRQIGGADIQIITENERETEFPQEHAIINFGTGPLSTYNLVNCIAIGGKFILPDDSTGSFLTHESPTDYLEQKRKLTQIKQILDKRSARIQNITLFHIDSPVPDVYDGGLTTARIIEMMNDFSNELFRIAPVRTTYSCGGMSCGKAIISPTSHETRLVGFKFPTASPAPTVSPTRRETFVVEVLRNNRGEKIYKCPICNTVTGTSSPANPNDTTLFSHTFVCPNKGKIPVEP